MLSFSLMSSTCSSEDEVNSNNNSQTIQQIETLIQSDQWLITNYVDSGQDETNNFSGYSFTFGADNSLTANNGINTIVGTWSIIDSSSSDDDSNSSDNIDFNIFFLSPSNFNELSEDWEIVSRTNSKIELIHISGGNGGTDNLTFEKI
ncbi:MAG: hypothetical protein GW839_12605 [Flavobacteriales bacterium]|nr:hypothetical protein [Flavobacteriia bacterium]NCP06285.1 hypothetical protein [Flavobacteriales bacterium]PIV95152.1 MAG: hypothetical protein COW44_00520 [Flavobacteriaceae bacterium CG17_big_fil_post_rev_8_21_14_2_50_33_15]PIY13419.1 MAG: hypothetical protein COZ17_00790 [Flavobacteriaceae bacterium CG_4_10_14_3_um_filter_33_47]PJB19743.1 MAG: hypothetical protein CO117_03635 [Flavobacteriaceae bacterium CG_4_9_14_3_um_filter_33_16]